MQLAYLCIPVVLVGIPDLIARHIIIPVYKLRYQIFTLKLSGLNILSVGLILNVV